ncbi:hypothetical protein ACHAWF_010199 [Thalassiosira exigua]
MPEVMLVNETRLLPGGRSDSEGEGISALLESFRTLLHLPESLMHRDGCSEGSGGDRRESPDPPSRGCDNGTPVDEEREGEGDDNRVTSNDDDDDNNVMLNLEGLSEWASTSIMGNLCGVAPEKPTPTGTVAKEVKDEGETSSLATSPFIAYDDGYEYPNLYDECDEMLQAATLVYPMASLRHLARQGKISDDGSILKVPLTASQVLDVVTKHEAFLKEDTLRREFYVDTLRAIRERHGIPTSPKDASGGIDTFRAPQLDHTQLIAFDDEFEKEELVYAIAINPLRKRITVCFRGSITNRDWATNLEIFMKDAPNPLKSHVSQTSTVKIHNGFHDYLFSPSERGAVGPNGETLSEYQEILQEHVLPVIKEYPSYKLYITGHSLGGALATLFAFEIAAEPDSVIPKPVTCVTFASPYVGDQSFREAHQQLERLGKLRSLRIVNHKDIVTTIPKMAFKLNAFDKDSHVGTLFKHVGMSVKMFHDSGQSVEVSYPKVRTGRWYSALDELGRGWDQALFSNLMNPKYITKWHLVQEYNRRLDLHKAELQGMQLNDLYSRDDVVGRLVAEF